jgi:hypothetical protein
MKCGGRGWHPYRQFNIFIPHFTHNAIADISAPHGGEVKIRVSWNVTVLPVGMFQRNLLPLSSRSNLKTEAIASSEPQRVISQKTIFLTS